MERVAVNQETQEQLCSGCKEWYPFSNFTKNSSRYCGLSSSCRQCTRKQWRDRKYKDLEKYKRRAAETASKRREINPEPSREALKRYAQKNRNKILAWARNRRQVSPQFKVAVSSRGEVRRWMLFSKKPATTEKLVGCNREEFRKYLESKFLPGMHWGNYGRTADSWQIDHITPVMMFDMTNEGERERCFHYTNTQPLWRRDNSLKLKEDLRLAKEQESSR